MDPQMPPPGMMPPIPPGMPGMGGGMPMPPQQVGPMSMGPPIGMDGMQMCPCCGQLMPSPNTMAGPNVPIPPGMMGDNEGQEQNGALLQALLGAGGSSGM